MKPSHKARTISILRMPDFICFSCAEKRNGEWMKEKPAKDLQDFCGICENFGKVAHKKSWFFPGERYGMFEFT